MTSTRYLPSQISQSNGLSFLVCSALIALPLSTQGATILANNTGLSEASITIIDNTDPGFTNNLGGANGADGPSITFGLDGLWSDAGNGTYSFTGLSDGVYNVYGTWHSNGDTSANGYTANGDNLGIFSITSEPDSSNGFTAYDEAVETSGEAEHFQFLGQVTVSGTGALDIVITPEGANGFGRYDAVGIANAVPEPGSTVLAALAAFGFTLRRRR